MDYIYTHSVVCVKCTSTKLYNLLYVYRPCTYVTQYMYITHVYIVNEPHEQFNREHSLLRGCVHRQIQPEVTVLATTIKLKPYILYIKTETNATSSQWRSSLPAARKQHWSPAFGLSLWNS